MGELTRISIVLLLYCITNAFCQIPYFTHCPKVTVMKDFDVEPYLGVWYEHEKYPFIFELGGKCIQAEYTLRPDGKIGVTNRQMSRIFGNQSIITGAATFDPEHPAKLTINFPTASGNDAPYWILDTDYQNYSVVYSCTSYGSYLSLRTVWILTRDRHPDQMYITRAYDVLHAHKVSKSFLTTTAQSGCPEREIHAEKPLSYK